MRITSRSYDPRRDYRRVGEFLTRTYRASGEHINWLQPRWAYMHHHPNILSVDRTRIGLFERGGEIVAVVHPEHLPGAVYFQIDPVRRSLERDLERRLVAYAEDHLSRSTHDRSTLALYINDRDATLQHVAEEGGYRKESRSEQMSSLAISRDLPTPVLPDGFRLKSLAEDDDPHKVHGLLHRGFGHGGEPPSDAVASRKFMQSAPEFALDLNIVVEAPGGAFVAYCGLWHEAVNDVAYIEPVATDPACRRMGLARAVILEGLRRCAARGATVAQVGSILPIHRSLAFARTSVVRCGRASGTATRPPKEFTRRSWASTFTLRRVAPA